MNLLILKRAAILSAALGLLIGVLGLLPFLIVYVFLTLTFLASPIVLVYMKKNNQIGWLDMQQSAFLGGVIGIACSVGFFTIFIPSVLIIHFLGAVTHWWNYYTYGLQYFLTFNSLWLFIIIAIMVILILALTNAVSGMGTNYVYNQIEKLPTDANEHVDIMVDDEI